MSVLSLRAVALLCLIALACTLISGGEDDLIMLNGLKHQSILLSLSEDPLSVLQAAWNFKGNTVAIYTNNQLTVYQDQFEGRLETLNNGSTLRIGQLRLEDSGLYTVAITFTEKTKDRKIYNLTVYEPVPTPSLKIVKWNVTDGRCDATLNCSVPNKNSSLSYTWKYTPTDLDFQLYNTNTTIQISLKNYSYLFELTCIVKNPVDQKNATKKDICVNTDGRGRSAAKGEESHRRYGLLAIILILIPLTFLGYYLIKKRKRRKETPAVPENVIREPQYIQVTTLPPNDDKQVWNNTMYDSSPRQKPKAVTVYAVLEHPMQKR